MSIIGNLNIIQNAVTDIKSAIIEKGQAVLGNISTYAEAIRKITGGGEETEKYMVVESAYTGEVRLFCVVDTNDEWEFYDFCWNHIIEYSYNKTDWAQIDYITEDNQHMQVADISAGCRLNKGDRVYLRGHIEDLESYTWYNYKFQILPCLMDYEQEKVAGVAANYIYSTENYAAIYDDLYYKRITTTPKFQLSGEQVSASAVIGLDLFNTNPNSAFVCENINGLTCKFSDKYDYYNKKTPVSKTIGKTSENPLNINVIEARANDKTDKKTEIVISADAPFKIKEIKVAGYMGGTSGPTSFTIEGGSIYGTGYNYRCSGSPSTNNYGSIPNPETIEGWGTGYNKTATLNIDFGKLNDNKDYGFIKFDIIVEF